MKQQQSMWRIMRFVVVGAVVAWPPALAWAALEVENAGTVTKEVEAQVEKLVAETQAKDPELADAIKAQADVCLRDLKDGTLDNASVTRDIEVHRDMQKEIASRVVETQVKDALTRGDPATADRIQKEFAAWQQRGGGEVMEVARLETAGGPSPSELGRGTVERGEAFKPSPEMVERMKSEMETWAKDHPEMAEHAYAEFDRMKEQGMVDQGERYGRTETAESARAGFEKWASDGAHSAGEIEQARAAMEKGFAEQTHGMEGGMERGMENAREGFEQWARESGASATEVEHAREAMEHYMVERDTSVITDNRVEMQLNTSPTPDPNNGETFVRTDPEGPVYRHSDGTCHNHGTNLPDNC